LTSGLAFPAILVPSIDTDSTNPAFSHRRNTSVNNPATAGG